MNIRIISDLHLAPHTQERNNRFVSFLEDAATTGDRVIIAGDLFDLWFGWKHLTFEYQKPILNRMKELAESGLELVYVEGNRDYGIAKYETQIFRVVSGLDYQTQLGKKRIFVEHGDLVNTKDRQYRLWRKASKNGVVYFLLDHLPGSILLRLASVLERKMRDTNLRYKAFYPDAESSKRTSEHFQKGYDIVIFGHFHEERFQERIFDGRNVLFYNLPGWEQGFRYLVIPETGEKPFFKEFTKNNGNSTAA